MVGTTIEFYDFYIYATAAVSVFPVLFFPKGNSTTALLASLATFGLAFVARPLGSILFGHFGDRVGRKATLVSSLLMMGIATFLIGLLPSYGQVGLLAPAALAPLFSSAAATGSVTLPAPLVEVEGAERVWPRWCSPSGSPSPSSSGISRETAACPCPPRRPKPHPTTGDCDCCGAGRRRRTCCG